MRLLGAVLLAFSTSAGCAATAPHTQMATPTAAPHSASEALPSIDRRLGSLEEIFGDYFGAPKKDDPRFASGLREWLAAERDLLLLAKQHPGDCEVETRLGELYRLGHNFDHPGAWEASEKHYKRAIDIDAARGRAYFGLGLLYVNSDLSLAPDAERLFRTVLELDDDLAARAWRGLFFAFYYQGRVDYALNAANKYIELAPNDPNAHVLRDTLTKVLAGRGTNPAEAAGGADKPSGATARVTGRDKARSQLPGTRPYVDGVSAEYVNPDTAVWKEIEPLQGGPDARATNLVRFMRVAIRDAKGHDVEPELSLMAERLPPGISTAKAYFASWRRRVLATFQDVKESDAIVLCRGTFVQAGEPHVVVVAYSVAHGFGLQAVAESTAGVYAQVEADFQRWAESARLVGR